LLALTLSLLGRQQRARFTLAGALALTLIGRLSPARHALSSALSLTLVLAPSLYGAFVLGAAGLDHVADAACSIGLQCIYILKLKLVDECLREKRNTVANLHYAVIR
jgi:hypothetical protein